MKTINVAKKMKIQCEYTDTFGGEANYTWVRRAELEVQDNATDRQIVLKAKQALGLTGVRCKTFNHGDSWELRPYGICTVLFITCP